MHRQEVRDRPALVSREVVGAAKTTTGYWHFLHADDLATGWRVLIPEQKAEPERSQRPTNYGLADRGGPSSFRNRLNPMCGIGFVSQFPQHHGTIQYSPENRTFARAAPTLPRIPNSLPPFARKRRGINEPAWSNGLSASDLLKARKLPGRRAVAVAPADHLGKHGSRFRLPEPWRPARIEITAQLAMRPSVCRCLGGPSGSSNGYDQDGGQEVLPDQRTRWWRRWRARRTTPVSSRDSCALGNLRGRPLPTWLWVPLPRGVRGSPHDSGAG